MLVPIGGLFRQKDVLRARLKAERRAANQDRPDAPVHAARNFMASIPLKPGAQIALYHPLDEELDTKPLAEALLEEGFEIGLPVVEKKNAPLVFRRFERGAPLIKGRFGIMTPEQSAPLFTPEVLVVPLLGFDKSGARIGYGGGFYDRTLEQLRAQGTVLAVGYAYGAQEVDAAPSSSLDQAMDWIVTERRAFQTGQ